MSCCRLSITILVHLQLFSAQIAHYYDYFVLIPNPPIESGRTHSLFNREMNKNTTKKQKLPTANNFFLLKFKNESLKILRLNYRHNRIECETGLLRLIQFIIYVIKPNAHTIAKTNECFTTIYPIIMADTLETWMASANSA